MTEQKLHSKDCSVHTRSPAESLALRPEAQLEKRSLSPTHSVRPLMKLELQLSEAKVISTPDSKLRCQAEKSGMLIKPAKELLSGQHELLTLKQSSSLAQTQCSSTQDAISPCKPAFTNDVDFGELKFG